MKFIVLSFFGRRKRSNTVAAAIPLSATVNPGDKDVYMNTKATKTQRSLLLLSRAPSLLVRRASRVGRRMGKEK